MAPQRRSVKNKPAFSYGVCPFCNKDILEGEKTNIEHVFPFSQLNAAYGTKFNKKERYTLNLEKNVKILVHKNCNSYDGDLEEKIANILDKLQKNKVQNIQLDYEELDSIFKYVAKTLNFLLYLPEFRGKHRQNIKNVKYVEIFRTNLPLGIIASDHMVILSFNGVAFVFGNTVLANTDTDMILIIKQNDIFHCRTYYYDNYIDTNVKKHKALNCAQFYKFRVLDISSENQNQIDFQNAVFSVMQQRDLFCLAALKRYNKINEEEPRRFLNLRRLIKSGDLNSSIFKAKKMMLALESNGVSENTINSVLNETYGVHITKKLNWVSNNKKFKIPDDLEDMVVNVDGQLQLFSGDDFINVANLQNKHEINRDIFLSGEHLETIDDLSTYRINGNVALDHNNLGTLDGAPSYIAGNFFCNDNELTTLVGAPQEVGGDFDCSNNKLESLEYAPQHVNGNFICRDNKITSLKGAPQYIGGNFDCVCDSLESLIGAPQNVNKTFVFRANKLKSLEHLPVAKKYKVYLSRRVYSFTSADKLCAWFNYLINKGFNFDALTEKQNRQIQYLTAIRQMQEFVDVYPDRNNVRTDAEIS